MNESKSRRELREIIKDPKKFNEELVKRMKKIDVELGWVEKPRKKKEFANKSLSVVFCCYNKRKALDKSLANTMGQLGPGDVVIVADGGSTDGVEKMLKKKYMPEIQFVQVEERTAWNLNETRNLGIKEAEKENALIVLMDADVIPQPTCLDALRKYGDPGVLASGVVVYQVPIKEQEKQAKRMKGMALALEAYGIAPMERLIADLEGDDPHVRGSIGSCLCFHRDDAERVGLFGLEYDGFYGCGDMDFILKMHYSGVTVKTPKNTPELRLAMGVHQPHRVKKKRIEKDMKRGLTLLRSKLEGYKKEEFR